MTASYVCKEIDASGKVVQAIYKGESKEEIVQIIRAKGHTPIKIDQEETKGQDLAGIALFKPKVKVKDVAIFCKQLFVMLHAGMPLLTSLEVLSEQTENKTIKEALAQMAISVQKGEILSMAMKRHSSIFPALLISMIETGELTGNLDSVLERMSIHYTKENKINSKIKGAMIYPMVLSVLATTVVIFMIAFILPTFTGMFEGSGVPLPGPTQFLLNLSDSIRGYWYIYIAVIGAAVFFIRRFTKSKQGKRAVDKFTFKLPMIKKQISMIITSRFTRTLATLLASGIPIIEALETSANVTNNMVVIEGMEKVTEDIKKGATLNALLKKIGVFPPMMVSMVGIGEESGALEEMLERAADYYDEELEAAISKLIALLEPLMIVVMGGLIGFIVVAMMLPMFDMMKTV